MSLTKPQSVFTGNGGDRENRPKSAGRRNLETIFEHTFSSKDAMVVQVVKDHEPKNDHKAHHFCFLSFIPGYDHDKKITLKIEPEKMMAICDAIRRVANGHAQSIGGKLEIYADPAKAGSDGPKKTITIEPGRDPQKPQAVLVFAEKPRDGAKGKSGQFFLSPPMAYGISRVLEYAGLKTLEIEFERQRGNASEPAHDESQQHTRGGPGY